MLRQNRVRQAIKKEVSNILLNEINDPRMGFITITDVEISPDLKYAKVFFSVLGKPEDYNKTKDALKSANGFIRKLVAERVQLRFAPEIVFREDHSAEYSNKIEEVLESIKEKEVKNITETDKKDE